MPRQNLPSYRLHKPTGQAIVGLGGQTVYLGKYKSKASREKYDQEIAKYLANDKQVPPTRSRSDIRIEEAIILFLEYAEEHYTKNGRKTKSFSNHQESLTYLNRWYGNKRISEFGPVALQYLRKRIVEEGQIKRDKAGNEYREDYKGNYILNSTSLSRRSIFSYKGTKDTKNNSNFSISWRSLRLCERNMEMWSQVYSSHYKRRTVNARIGCIVNFYRWLVTNEKCPVDVWTALKAVPRLAKGKSKAKESEPVHPIEWEIVEATLPYLSSVVADMVRVQLLTGARPGEVCCMRPCDIDQNHPVAWKFIPNHHKTDYLDHARQIPIGPQAQAILRPYLDRLADNPEQNIFSPKESVRQKNEQKRRNRKCKVYESQERYRKSKRATKTPKRPPKDHYTTDSYRQAIERAAKKGGLRHWTPHQLRHNAGTGIREKYGLDAAQAVLGHSNAKVTEIYAELNFDKAARIAAEIG